MKQIFTGLLLLVVTATTFAQQADLARTATDQLTAKYSLTPAQAEKMYTIQLRKYKYLHDLEAIKASSEEKYLTKLDHLQRGTLASINHLLDTESQRELFQNTQRSVRVKRSQAVKAVGKAPKAAIKAAELALYEE